MNFDETRPEDPLVTEIRARLRAGHYQHDIAADVGHNQGRISEIKNGKRHRLKRRKRPDYPSQPSFT